MGLYNQIRRKLHAKKWKPYHPSEFHVVKVIVEKYGLDESLVEKPYSVPEITALNGFRHIALKAKRKLEIPPFSLVDHAQYLLVKKITDKFSNPYLQFARSPEEIVLSMHLYSLNSSIPHELLEELHFESLFLTELARKRIEILSAALREEPAKLNRKRGMVGGDGVSEQVGANAMELQIKGLMEFISFVERPKIGKGEKWTAS